MPSAPTHAQRRGVAVAIAAAALFGASTPAAKTLLAGGQPARLAEGLYAGSGLALGFGPSPTLFIAVLRQTGTARTAAYLSVPPSIGAALSVGFHGDRRTRADEW